jgi:hypothetical protein
MGKLLATVALVVVTSAAVFANGEEFFAPAGDVKVDLVYVGRIKDAITGRSITAHADFLIEDHVSGLTFPFQSDRPGHFRSPDVGMAIKELGEQVDTGKIELSVKVDGYKLARLTKLPRGNTGTVEVNLSLEPEDPTAAAAAAGKMPMSRIPLIGGLIILAIAVGARTIGRRQSTTRSDPASA